MQPLLGRGGRDEDRDRADAPSGVADGSRGRSRGSSRCARRGRGQPELDGRHPIVAPLVGTFYRPPQPGAKPFVEEGDVVDEGQTVAIVEAMKLMNQVKADQAGKVAADPAARTATGSSSSSRSCYLEPVGD